ncbi:MAG TPA: hypothetical protein VEO19_01325 [Terriglobia bacterium]|nr:hypothetical protein [Terriglobia bacterium]
MNNMVDKLLKDGNLVGLKMRPARALIGWMSEQDAYTILAIPMVPGTPRPEHVQKVKEAHRAVQYRTESLDQTHVLSDPGEELRDYLAELGRHPCYKPYIAKGCSVRVADLSKLGAVQPVVHLDHAEHFGHFRRLLLQARQEDMLSLAKITLPIPTADMGVQSEQQKDSWVLRFTHPDARVVGHFSAPIDLAAGLSGMGYGFCVAVLPSFVQVAYYRCRYFLKDGYHRSLALLERRITHIPVIFQELPESLSLEVEGRFPDGTILAPQAPLLPDYLRDDVAAVVSHPTSQKIITIRATEDHCWGL